VNDWISQTLSYIIVYYPPPSLFLSLPLSPSLSISISLCFFIGFVLFCYWSLWWGLLYFSLLSFFFLYVNSTTARSCTDAAWTSTVKNASRRRVVIIFYVTHSSRSAAMNVISSIFILPYDFASIFPITRQQPSTSNSPSSIFCWEKKRIKHRGLKFNWLHCN